jgi:flagellar M-ring protein FliF
MGYDEARGDSISVANAPFTPVAVVEEAGLPVWKDPENVAFGKEILKYLLIAGILFALYRVAIRPAIQTMFPPPPAPERGEEGDDTGEPSGEEGEEGSEAATASDPFAVKLKKAREIAQDNPKAVADIIKDWLGVNGNQ